MRRLKETNFGQKTNGAMMTGDETGNWGEGGQVDAENHKVVPRSKALQNDHISVW